MFRVSIIVLYGPDKTLAEIYDRFKDKIPKPFLNKYHAGLSGIVLPLLSDSAEFAEAIELSKSLGLKEPELHSEVYYTKKELDECKFFKLHLPDPLELEGIDTKKYGTEYIGCCPDCGFGGKLSGDVLIDRKYMKKYKMGILVPEVYVSEDIKNLIEDSNLTGISFERRVVDYKGREIPNYYVASIHNVLPPMSNTTWLRGEWKRSCGHSIVYLCSDIQYEEDKLAHANDFNLSFEHINNDMMQAVIISSKAKKILQANHCYCWYFPITIV